MKKKPTTFVLNQRSQELLNELKEMDFSQSQLINKLIVKHAPKIIEKYKSLEENNK